LEHIGQVIERATRYVELLGAASALRKSEQIQDAVVRNIEIKGEAAVRIQRMDPEFVAGHAELPWTEMRGMGNGLSMNISIWSGTLFGEQSSAICHR
jgi:uncharacterized protein with HEPN domain